MIIGLQVRPLRPVCSATSFNKEPVLHGSVGLLDPGVNGKL